MAQYRARPLTSANDSEVTIGLFEGKEKATEVIREAAPAAFPPELLFHLADFMARGFNAAFDRQPVPLPDLTEFALSLRGRPVVPEVQRMGLEAAKLRSQGLTYGQIAKKLCPEKDNKRHHCGKKCTDRIRQAAQLYLKAVKAS